MVIRDQAEKIEKLNLELAWLKRQIFGSKSEHYVPMDDIPSLFPVEEPPAQPEEYPPTTVSEIPADLLREERMIGVPEDQLRE